MLNLGAKRVVEFKTCLLQLKQGLYYTSNIIMRELQTLFYVQVEIVKILDQFPRLQCINYELFRHFSSVLQ